MNDKPKKLILGYIQNNKCNLRCEYCYYTQREIWNEYNGVDLPYPAEYVAKALSPERLGGISLINLTGQGETLLCKDIVELTYQLLIAGHYIEIVTNGTIKKNLEKILEFDTKLLKHLEFKVSFHYIELKKKKMLDVLFENIQLIKEKQCSFTLELVPTDSQKLYKNEILKLCMEKLGAPCQLTVARDDAHNRNLLTDGAFEDYCKDWEDFGSEMFDFKIKLLNKKRREFCYAGAWSLFINLSTGEASPCYGQPVNQNIYQNVTKKIQFIPVGHYCTEPYCINGHAHMTMGLIPELNAPSFADIRNRMCKDGTEFFSKECKDFFSKKLYSTNKKYSKKKQVLHSLYYPVLLTFWIIKKPKIALAKIKRWIKYSTKK